MNRSGVLLLGLCLLGVAGCDDDSTAPSNLPIVMTASLSPANEVPPIANAENTGRGAVQITFNVTRDGTGAITGGTADFHFQLSGFPSSTDNRRRSHPSRRRRRQWWCHRQHRSRRIKSGDTDGRRDVLHFDQRLCPRCHAPEHREQSGRLLLQRALADEWRRRRTRTARSLAVTKQRVWRRAGPDSASAKAPARLAEALRAKAVSDPPKPPGLRSKTRPTSGFTLRWPLETSRRTRC